MMENNIKMIHDQEQHLTICKKNSAGKIYVGKAICHEADYQFESKLAGETIAYIRSNISELKDKKNKCIKNIARLQSKKLSIQDKKIIRTIDYQLNKERILLKEYNKNLNTEYKHLREYIHNLDVLHKKILKMRGQND